MACLGAEDLTCAICLEPFASPVALYCGHCFDRECLNGLVGEPCPICRQAQVPANVNVQPKNALIFQAALSLHPTIVAAIVAREVEHERLRLARLASYPKPNIRTRRTTSPDVNVSWGSVVFVQALSFPWDAIFGPAGLQDDEEETPESCVLSWSIVFMFAGCYIMSQAVTYLLDF
ncbi:hypothetical protein THRCLA_02772 [Thraustotheca clavata]|uniref:RING-type domain-containing protein n=1 Tax=Thraustotheca clavata TaxID=74557 RepID=A0A1W0A425_9STRA|nr:hypothetical protein THRCLA_02772 [Thraustotheca clavata]